MAGTLTAGADVKPPLASTRIIGAPWTMQEVDNGTDFPAITPLKAWGSLSFASCGLSPAQGRRLCAFHEAAHTVLFDAAGYAIREVAIYPEDQRAADPWQNPGGGHTGVGEEKPGRRIMPGRVFMAILAGQVASEMWIEQEGLSNDRSRLLVYSTAGPDHERLLFSEGAVFLYGDAETSAHCGGEFRVDRLIGRARHSLKGNWGTVTSIARLLDERGRLDGDDLAAMLGGAP